VAVAAGAAALVAASGFLAWILDGPGSSRTLDNVVATYTVRRDDLTISLKRQGTLEAEKAISVRPQIRGGAKIVWLVENGTKVKKGEVLVRLDTTDLDDQIEMYESQVVKSEADLLAAQTDEEITSLDAESKTAEARLTYEMAKLEIKKFEEGTRAKEARDAQIKIDQAKVKLLDARSIDARMPKMLEQGFVTKSEVAQSKLDVETASNALRTAELENEIQTKYTHPMTASKLSGELRQAEAQFRRREQEAKRLKARAEAVTAQRKLELRRAKSQLDDAREQLERMTIRAGGDGIVIYGSGRRRRWRQEEELKVGMTAFNNQVLMRLPDLDTMQVICEIHEADINKVRVDKANPQPAVVTIENLPGESFPAYVKHIDTLAQSHWYKQNVKFFLTTIALKEQIPKIRPGTTAMVEIAVGEVRNVLRVPVQCVETLRSKTYCYMADGGEARPVVIGASNNDFVEIKQGLEKGDTILMERPAGAQDAAEPEPDKEETERSMEAGANGLRGGGGRKGAR